MIRKMTVQDSARVLEIYKMGLETRNATFETNVPSWSDWDSNHISHSRFVYVDNDKILGWVALSPYSKRLVYSGVAEVSIYVDIQTLSKGIGSSLIDQVIASSEEQSIWTLCSSVFSDNTATLKLHEKFGFRVIGFREKIARLDDTWRDTILLERRSKKTGI
jgi:L-amino acid N-acyltransferase YncA